jgi:hypothetical protein
MSKETERRLRKWRELSDDECLDATGDHLREFGRWYDFQVSAEGLRILKLMLEGDDADASADAARDPLEWVAIEAVLDAVASVSKDGAFASVAAALGVDADNLQDAVTAWYEGQDNLPPPVSPAQLIELIAEQKADDDFRKNDLDGWLALHTKGTT